MYIYADNNYHSDIRSNNFSNNATSLQGNSLGSRAEILDNFIKATNVPFLLSGTVPTEQTWYLTQNKIEGTSFGSSPSSILNTIYLNNTEDVRIQANTYIRYSSNTIKVSGGQKNKILYNPDVTNYDINGIGFVTTASPLNSIRCNYIKAPTAFNVLNNNANSEFSGNQLEGSLYNLQYGTPLNTYAVSGPQYFRDNYFDLSSSLNPKAIHYGTSHEVNQSLYKVNLTDPIGVTNFQGNHYYPYFAASNPSWFSLSSGFNYICEKKIEEEEPQHRESQAAYENIALLNSGIAASYGPEVEFDTRLKLMRYLTFLYSVDELSPEQNDWYHSLQNTAYDNFISAENIIKTASILPEETEQSLLEIESSIDELSGDLSKINYMSFDEEIGTFLEDEALKEEFIAVTNALNAKIAEKSAILNENKEAMLNALPIAMELNEAVTLDGTISMSNLKTINGLLYKRLSSDTLNFTNEEKAIIVEIANQCIGMGGEAVPQARTLRSEFDREYVEYNDECLLPTDPVEHRNVASTANNTYSISPNPANAYTVLTIPISDIDRRYSIMDLQGKVVKTGILPAKSEQVMIEMDRFESGVYYIKVNDQNIGKKLVKIN